MRTLKYILTISLFALLPAVASAQKVSTDSVATPETKTIVIPKAKSDTVKFNKFYQFRGINVSADIFGCAYSLIEDYISGEVAIEANFGNLIYPVFEVGYGKMETTDETTGIYYKSAAPYYRAGFNINCSNRDGEIARKNYIYALARIGWTNPKYSVQTPPIYDPIWGGSASLDLTDVDGAYSWAELGVGVNVSIFKNFRMGWTIRYKARIDQKVGSNSKVWYAPGFGTSRHTTFGGTYSIIYNIPM